MEKKKIVYRGSYVNFTIEQNERGDLYFGEMNSLTVRFHETHEKIQSGKDERILHLDGHLEENSENLMLQREVAFKLFMVLDEESARIEMRELFLSGHEKGKYVYLMQDVRVNTYVDDANDVSSNVTGRVYAFTTATQCVDFYNSEISYGRDDCWAINVLPLNNWKSGEPLSRSFVCSPYVIDNRFRKIEE